ncbi:MAG: hypothetical protein ACLSIL_10095 [Enterococcus casseliflavus]
MEIDFPVNWKFWILNFRHFSDLPVNQKLIRSGIVEYHFQTVKPTRLHLISTGETTYNDSHKRDLGYGAAYDPIKTPHILVAGGTGSG